MESHLITIIASEGLDAAIERDLLAVGVAGYTAWTVSGAGKHGVRPTRWTNANVRIEAVVDPSQSLRVLAMLAEKYPREQGVFVFLAPVQVPPLYQSP